MKTDLNNLKYEMPWDFVKTAFAQQEKATQKPVNLLFKFS